MSYACGSYVRIRTHVAQQFWVMAANVPTQLWTSCIIMHPLASSKRPNTDSSVNKLLRKRLRPDGTPRGAHGGVRVGSGRKPKAATTLTVAVARQSHSPPAGPSRPAGTHIRQWHITTLTGSSVSQPAPNVPGCWVIQETLYTYRFIFLLHISNLVLAIFDSYRYFWTLGLLNFLYFSSCGVSGGLVLFVGVGGGVRSVGL
jgi:hypothetical protein